MRSVLARPALLAALALALAACSADRPLAPAPPSLAGATGGQGNPSAVPPTLCLSFDSLPVGTRWGADEGTLNGGFVHEENYTRMYITNYYASSTAAPWYRHAVVDTARFANLTRHALRLDTVGMIFDFTQVPFPLDSVTFYFADHSPLENMRLNGGYVHFGQIGLWYDWPGPAGRVVIHSGIGKIKIVGDVDQLQIGGTNNASGLLVPVSGLWLDTICWFKAALPGQQENPNPL